MESAEFDRALSLLLRRDQAPSSGEEGCPLLKSVCEVRGNKRLGGARTLLETGLDGREVSESNSGPCGVSDRSD